MKTGDVSKLTPDQRKKWALQLRLRGMYERAQTADQGAWGRTHSIIQSFHRDRGNVVIALAEVSSSPTLLKYVGTGLGGTDPTKEFANSRHIVGASPRGTITLIEKIWEAFPELKDYD